MQRFFWRNLCAVAIASPSPSSSTALARPPPPPPPAILGDFICGGSNGVKRSGVLAVKRGMTALWDSNGERLPLTVLQVMDCTVIRSNMPEADGRSTLVLSCFDQAKKLKLRVQQFLSRPEGFHPNRELVECKVSPEASLPVGFRIGVQHFIPGQYVDVIGTSKGKGMAGPMKRWGFKGGPASHGASLFHRGHGATGNRKRPGRVFPNKKMAGRMGGERTTVHSLFVHKIDYERQLLLVKGAVPGPNKGFIFVRDALRDVKTKLPVPTNIVQDSPRSAIAAPPSNPFDV